MQEIKNRPSIAQMQKNFLDVLVTVTGVRAAALLALDIWGGKLKNTLRLRLESSSIFSETQGQIIIFESPLAGLSDVQFVQFATRKEEPGAPGKGLIANGFTLTTGLALLIFMLLRQILQKTTVNDLDSAKSLHMPAIFNLAS